MLKATTLNNEEVENMISCCCEQPVVITEIVNDGFRCICSKCKNVCEAKVKFKDGLDHREISSLGGKMTYLKYGRKYMAKNGRKGAAAQLKKDPNHFLKLAEQGRLARLNKSKSRKH